MTMAAVSVIEKTKGEMLSIKEAADRIGLSPRATTKLVDDKVIRAIDVSGGRYPKHRILRIPAEELQQFFLLNSTKPLNDPR